MRSGNPASSISLRILGMPEPICSMSRILVKSPKIRGFRDKLFRPIFLATTGRSVPGLVISTRLSNISMVCVLFALAAMGKRIDDGFLEYLQCDSPNFFSRFCTFNLVCYLQFAFQPFYSFIVLLKERATKSFVVNNIHFVRSPKQYTAHNCMEKNIGRMLGKKQHPATLATLLSSKTILE